ncbi:hypothetical protein ABPG74_003603 [Tetrahymena malaccensis]
MSISFEMHGQGYCYTHYVSPEFNRQRQILRPNTYMPDVIFILLEYYLLINIGENINFFFQKERLFIQTKKEFIKKLIKIQIFCFTSEIKQRKIQGQMFDYNTQIRSLYGYQPSYILTIWMCIIGFAKAPYLIYIISQVLIYDYNAIFSNDGDPFMNKTVQLMIGIGASIITLMAFSFKVSRRLVIFIAEGSFIAALVLIYLQNYTYHSYLLGFTVPYSTFIYPLYLDEISYNLEYHNLANYLQLSYIVSQLYISFTLESKTFDIILISLSGLNIVICLSNSIKETTLYWYMNNEYQKGDQNIQLMHTSLIDDVKNYFQNYKNRKNIQSFRNGVDRQQAQKRQLIRDLKVLLLSFLIPQTQVFNYFRIFNSDFYDLSYTNISIILVTSFVALIILQFISHSFIQKVGIMIFIYLNVIQIIEYKIDDLQNQDFEKNVQFFVLNCLVVSVWIIQSFQQIRIRLIWLQQLIFWISIYLSCYSQANDGYFQIGQNTYIFQIGQLLLSGFIGFLIVC